MALSQGAALELERLSGAGRSRQELAEQQEMTQQFMQEFRDGEQRLPARSRSRSRKKGLGARSG
jgi:hypothetical protein